MTEAALKPVVTTSEDIEQDWDLSSLDHPNAVYDKETKLKAVTLFIQTNNMSKVARELNIPYSTVQTWRRDAAWWSEAIASARKTKNQELDNLFTKTIHDSMDEIQDRIRS